jgi:Uncharacterized conserved protein
MASYRGSCHCGAVAFEAELDLSSTITCNCSRCRRLGAILAFTPAAAFTLTRGEDHLTEYRFNKHLISHLFCRTCGVQSFSRGAMPDGTPMVAVNVRTIETVDLDALTPTAYDGRSA